MEDRRSDSDIVADGEGHPMEVNPMEVNPMEENPMEDRRSDREILAEEEDHLYSLFNTVLNQLMHEHGISDELVTEAIDRIVESFRFDLGKRPSDVDYSEAANRIGYLFQHGTLGAGLALTRVQRAIRNCPELKYTLLGQKELNVVSLGGGPGNDVIGFCSALQELDFEGGALRLTVVDRVQQWDECNTLAFKLLRAQGSAFGRASELFRHNEVQVQFLSADVTQDNEVNRDYLNKAHLILLTRLFNSMNLNEISRLMQVLHRYVGPSTLLIVINVPLQLNQDGSLRVYSNCDHFFGRFEVLFCLPDYKDRYDLQSSPSRFGRRQTYSNAGIAVLRKRE